MILKIQSPTSVHPMSMVLFSIVFVNLIFYLDEGYFNFSWIEYGGNWILFFMYFIFTLLGQALITALFHTQHESFLNSLFKMSSGAILGCAVLIFLLS